MVNNGLLDEEVLGEVEGLIAKLVDGEAEGDSLWNVAVE